MIIDVVTIFPDYLSPLELSLAGKARDKGLLDVAVHDLRSWTTDRHHSVDDTPYGGGAGMVMKPEPWGAALDEVAPDGAVLVVPTPSGTPFSQALAAELATRPHLVFACGRYEGIDQRVLDEAATRLEVREVSLGDYVLNGGEVAALAIIEAIARLVPGFMGNAASLAEESHNDGLLEYPVYTKPASWRGRDVPKRCCPGTTAASPPGAGLRPNVVPRSADPTCATRPRPWATWSSGWSSRPTPVSCSRCSARAGCRSSRRIRASRSPLCRRRSTTSSRLDGHRHRARRPQRRPPGRCRACPSVGRRLGHRAADGRPDLQGSGLGRELLARVEQLAPEGTTELVLFTGAGSERNQRMYKRAGYRLRGEIEPGVVRLTKKR